MLTRRAFPALFLLTLATVSLPVAAPEAQRLRDSQRSQSDDWCARERYNNSDREQFCEVRQYTVPASGTVSVNAAPNGGIDVQGEGRGDVLVQAKVTAQAETQARAKQIADSVRISTQPDISADGPSGLGRREGWSVSYRLAVPSVASLSLKSTNGGISIRDVDGQIDFRTVNGGVRLVNLAGDVKGRTSNGGVDVDLEGPGWKGEGLNVETSNGGVTLRIPEQYSAHLETSTINGGMNIDFPLTVQGRIDREINANLGAGGAPIRVTTHNGGVKIAKK
jgi:DUF4097 and DUF4098 domain-containing protein YvlB